MSRTCLETHVSKLKVPATSRTASLRNLYACQTAVLLMTGLLITLAA